ncbi:MAG: glycosyltransferase family 2 protein [Candidatus Jacksonbacteria bacterium]|nr:glycosyltransferase family 2 protein [Candidatus Jacksonbacteria bacterium]
MTESSKTLTIIIPAFNEEDTIITVLERIAELGLPNCEVIVADDGSYDKTKERVAAYQKTSPLEIILIALMVNAGKSKAIQAGLARAAGVYTVIQDADLEYDPSDIVPLLKKAKYENADAVYGSRFVAKPFPKNMGIMNWFANRGITMLANILYGARLTDQSTCYKLVKTDLLKSLSLKSSGFEFCAEVTAKLRKRGVCILEVPVSYSARRKKAGKKIKWFHIFPIVRTLILERVR